MIDRTLNFGREIVSTFLARAAPYGSVLDIGAGTGADLASARRHVADATLLAVDADARAVSALVERGIRAERLDIEHDVLPAADESIGVVIANQTLEHVKELFWVLHETSRVLEVGGSLIIGVPNLASLHNRLLLLLGRQPTVIKSASAHVRGFTRPDLVSLLDWAFPEGYRQVQFAGANFYPLPPRLARPAARWLPSLAWGMFFRFRKTRRYAGEFLTAVERAALETPFYVGRAALAPPSPATRGGE